MYLAVQYNVQTCKHHLQTPEAQSPIKKKKKFIFIYGNKNNKISLFMYLYVKLKPQEQKLSPVDHMEPIRHPKDKACSHPIEPTAYPSHSNAANSPDPDVDPGKAHGSCPRRAHVGSTGDPLALFPQRTPAKMGAMIPAHRSVFSFGAPSILQSWLCNSRPAIAPS